MNPIALFGWAYDKHFHGTVVLGSRRSWRKELRHQDSDSRSEYARARTTQTSVFVGLRASLDGLQFLAGLKAHGFPGRNRNLGAGPRVAPNASLSGANVEHAKSTQLNTVASGKRTLHALEDRFDGQFSLGFRDSSLVHHFIDNVEFNHRRLPRALESEQCTKWLMLREISEIVNGRSLASNMPPSRATSLCA